MAQVIICDECKNEIHLDANRQYQVGDIIECEVCGTEYEVVRIEENGDVVVKPIEEEK